MIIGGHVSIAGGFDKSIDRAVALGANALQTFASSPRSLKVNDFGDEILEKYLSKKAAVKMGPHYFHGVYLVNLAHEAQEYRDRSVDSLVFYQQLAGKINGAGTIFHTGSHKGKGFDLVKKEVATSVEEVLKRTPDGVKLFLENAAGHKGVIGTDLLELRYIYESISSKELQSKLAVCFDTQHGFAAGFDMRDEQSLQKSVDRINLELDISLVEVIHANDSMMEFDSRRDRHQNIGEGEIGEKGFTAVVNHPSFKDLPFLMEVPGENKSGPRSQDIDKLRSLRK